MASRPHPHRRVVAASVLAVLVTACRFSTPVKAILDDPRGYDGKVVKVSGKVSGTFGFFGVKTFRLSDGTGEIAVVTDRPLPKDGQEVSVEGRVREAFALGTVRGIVILEGSLADERPKGRDRKE